MSRHMLDEVLDQDPMAEIDRLKNTSIIVDPMF